MFENRKFGHIGLATNDVEKDVKWYIDKLGYEVIGKFDNNGSNAYFLKNGSIVYEIYQADPILSPEEAGKIDHFAFDSTDIEADYAYCVKNGYQITTDGIEAIDSFWDNGVRFFKVASPTGEQIEFCQIL